MTTWIRRPTGFLSRPAIAAPVLVHQRHLLEVHVSYYHQFNSELPVCNFKPKFDFWVRCCHFWTLQWTESLIYDKLFQFLTNIFSKHNSKRKMSYEMQFVCNEWYTDKPNWNNYGGDEARWGVWVKSTLLLLLTLLQL